MKYKTRYFSAALLTSTAIASGVTQAFAGPPIEEVKPFTERKAPRFLSPLNNVKEFAEKKIDQTTEKAIRSFSQQVSTIVHGKVRDIFFLDKQRTGVVAETGQAVKIYMNNSQMLNSLFEIVEGYSIDDLIKNLPFGTRQVAGAFRTQLEHALVDSIIGDLTKAGIEEATSTALLEAYGYSKNACKNLFLTPSKELDADDFVDIGANSKDLTAEDFFDTSAINSKNSQILNLDQQYGGITVGDLIDGYKAKLRMYVNEQLNTFLVEAVAETAKNLTHQGVDKAFNGVSGAISLASILFPGGTSARLVGGAALSYIYKDDVKEALGNKVSDWGKRRVEKIIHPQTNLLGIDYDKLGKVTTTKVSLDPDDESIGEWQVLNYRENNLTNFAAEKVEETKKGVHAVANAVETATQGATKVVEAATQKVTNVIETAKQEATNKVAQAVTTFTERVAQAQEDISSEKPAKPEAKKGFLGSTVNYFLGTMGNWYSKWQQLGDIDFLGKTKF